MGEDRPLVNFTDYTIRSIEQHQDYPAILVVMCLLSIFSVAGTVGNAFVIYVFSKQRDKPTSTMFIITLAATDFFTCLCIVPHTMVWEYLSKRMQYDAICKIYNFLITSNVPFSFFIMVAIAFDRYFKICRPWTHAMDPPVAKRVIVGLLIFALSLGIIPSFSYGIYERKDSVNTTLEVVDVSEYSAVSGDISMTTTPLVNYSSYDSSNRDKLSNATGKPLAYYYGMCVVSERYFSIEVRMFYQKIYASLFLIASILVAILYGLIFKSLMTRRARKLKNSMSNGNTCKSQVNQTSTASQTCISSSRFVTNEEQKATGDTSNESLMPRKPPLQSNKDREREKIKTVREKQRIANIKTAGILFIVTAVFIAAFLPAWLMAVRMIPANMILFYMYFSYNVANPIIYAFFNRAFRAEMKNVIHCKKSY
ncbi:probable G-protein coupled receptor No18 [Mizuhopecten yessoensis]|uniref:5-hydroxytryptamine receptor 1A-alpha n=1 Tax=Mizuhopecten yessoensis TaxID=6573 RepID=A0A210QRZ0_MIZYE|nr:probable G-protein coupled receptor No18 [Mizuhopecten yessoensis]OWF51512.1 5-hydroxytryptamine receptor 1A-alpha [Mizuhopecten yessoensis]